MCGHAHFGRDGGLAKQLLRLARPPRRRVKKGNPLRRLKKAFRKEDTIMENVTGHEEDIHHRRSHLPMILGTIALLAAGDIYFLSQNSKLAARLGQLEGSMRADFSQMEENWQSSAGATQKTLEALRAQLADERGQALRAANQASRSASRHADELAQKLETEQQQVASALGEVKESATTTNAKVADVINHVSTVDSQVSQARSDLDKTIADLKSVQGDMGVQSGLIATNGKELAALRELGERNYVEFDVRKTNQPQRVGSINLILRKADPKRNRFTVDVIADDKKVEKKDRAINEPVQFYLSRAHQPYELVVNEVKKDQIVGYLAVPKVLTTSR
jgi:chromosome segregation ATPase